MESILIVETDPAEGAQLKQFLSSWGYEITLLENAQKAIAHLSVNTPDLAIIDLHLEDHPGIEILKHIRDTDGPIPMPVFTISTEDSPEIRIVCMSTGADDFLTKPINLPDVAMKVQQALERARYRKEIQALNAKLEKDKKSLLRYFSEDLVEKILNEEISTELGGTIIEATIMFFDIRSSTTLAEKIGPQEYAQTISELFGDLMDIVFGRKGSINELLGDGFLATFGCPFPHAGDAENALDAALAIEAHMQMVNDLRRSANQFVFGYGMGVASGRIFAGNIGSVRMMKYAVMGDPVNTAARLEELTKRYPYPIIADEATISKTRHKESSQALPSIQLRGKTTPTRLFGVGAKRSETEFTI